MQMWADVQLGLAEARRQQLEAEAAAVRLTATSPRSAAGTGLRGSVGRALIRVGHVLAPEPAVAHHHHHRTMARQP